MLPSSRVAIRRRVPSGAFLMKSIISLEWSVESITQLVIHGTHTTFLFMHPWSRAFLRSQGISFQCLGAFCFSSLIGEETYCSKFRKCVKSYSLSRSSFQIHGRMLRDRLANFLRWFYNYDDFVTKLVQDTSGKGILLSEVSGCSIWLSAIPTTVK